MKIKPHQINCKIYKEALQYSNQILFSFSFFMDWKTLKTLFLLLLKLSYLLNSSLIGYPLFLPNVQPNNQIKTATS